MIINANSLMGSAIHAGDGEIGKVTDIYFDDKSWMVRYVVVSCDGWLDRKELLLIPSSLKIPDSFKPILKTDLTVAQIKKSPTVSNDLPVSRQFESELHSYYTWTPYWTYPMYSNYGFSTDFPRRTMVHSRLNEDHSSEQKNFDVHLRSLKAVKGYHIKAIDDELGHVVDMLINRERAEVTHFVVDTVNWWPSKHVLIETGSIKDIDWETQKFTTSLDRKTIKSAPEFDPIQVNDEEYLEKLSNYYKNLKQSWPSQGEFLQRKTHAPRHSSMI